MGDNRNEATLAKGTTLGPYVIDSLIGAGGMGEVYRAHDTRLGRTVAIKIVPPTLISSTEHRARFEREARAISALASPHICTLFDVGQDNGVDYLVMEYLDGETLATRLGRGPLPFGHVIRHAAEIAEALWHAHQAGVIHRDLKPANVMLTGGGVKLLDFGLAKIDCHPSTSADDTRTTPIHAITNAGTIIGTPAYMAPEQIDQRPIDHRTDVFAFGIILYEMIAGRRPFAGDSHVKLIASIVSDDPESLRLIRPTCPVTLERIVFTALAKSPSERWQTAHDLALQLRWLLDAADSQTIADVPRARTLMWRRLMHYAVATLVGGLLAIGAERALAPAPHRSAPFRLSVAPPAGVLPVNSPESNDFALSPDGQTLAFAGLQNGTQSIFLRRLDSVDVHKVEGSDRGQSPFWSDDGRWIGFSAGAKVWKTNAIVPSVPQPLFNTTAGGVLASWHGDTILFTDFGNGRRGVHIVSASGGAPRRITALKPNERRHSWPLALSDGRHFLYLDTIPASRTLVLAAIDSPRTTELISDVSKVALLEKDEIVFVRQGRLLRQRFDLARERMIGEPVVVADQIAYFYPTGRAAFDAANGVLIYQTNSSTTTLLRSDRSGRKTVINDSSLFSRYSLACSPDGARAAVTVIDRATGMGDIWLYNLVRGGREQFTDTGQLSIAPAWSPDGTSIAYTEATAGVAPHILVRSVNSSKSVALPAPQKYEFAECFSPTGAEIYYTVREGLANRKIFRLDIVRRRSEAVLDDKYDESDPRVSPDGKWMAFTSTANGISEVDLIDLGRSERPRMRISTSGGDSARWRGDGKELFYVSAQRTVVGVVPSDASWTNLRYAQLFSAPPYTRFDVSRDGQAFFFVSEEPGPNDSLFNVVLNRPLSASSP